MKRLIRFLVILSAGIAIGFMVRQPQPAPSSEMRSPVSPIEAVLDRPIPDVWFVDVPFEQAVRQLAERANAPIHIDSAAMRAAGIDVSQRVTVRGRNLLLADALQDLAATVNTPSEHVMWWPQDSRIVLTTVSALANTGMVLTRKYDVRDLLLLIPAQSYLEGPTFELFPTSATTAAAATMTRAEAVDLLSRLIQESVAPDTWREVGGFIGAIKELGGNLIITQTPDAHRQVRGLLNELRSLAGPIKPPEAQPPEAFRWDSGREQWVSQSTQSGQAKLRIAIESFETRNEPLSLAVERLAAEAGLFHRFSPALEPSLLDVRVTVRTLNMPAGQTLRTLLDEAASVGKVAAATGWWLEGEVVFIGNQEDADRHLILEMYDMRDWLQLPAMRREHIAAKLPADHSALFPSEKLDNLIQASVAPTSWRETGGRGYVRIIGDHFFIAQTAENHEKVKLLLDGIRRSATQPAAEAK